MKNERISIIQQFNDEYGNTQLSLRIKFNSVDVALVRIIALLYSFIFRANVFCLLDISQQTQDG